MCICIDMNEIPTEVKFSVPLKQFHPSTPPPHTHTHTYTHTCNGIVDVGLEGLQSIGPFVTVIYRPITGYV